MRLTALFVMPALFLIMLEAGLRLSGFGHAPQFFLPKTIGDRTYLETNDRFTFRFFPRALARSVVPHRLEVPNPPHTYRILLFGESAANGDPDAAYGFGRFLEVLLGERFPGVEFEVVCTAVTAVNSHVILPIARGSARAEADLWLIYMGNNEVIGPYGPATVFGSQSPPLPLVRAGVAARGTRTGQAVKVLAERLAGRAAGGTPAWEGINLFAENLLPPDDPARTPVYNHFRRNLDDILDAGERAGIPVLLSTVATNLRDCAPFASLHSGGMSADRLAEWTAYYDSGKTYEADGAYREALAQFRRAADIDAGFAELLYRMGRCHEALEDFEEARRAYALARDADALVVRADSTINQIIREAAARRDSVRLVDAEKHLGLAGTGEIPGRNLFFEHVHFTPVGNDRIARIFADAVLEVLPTRILETDTGDWPGPATCQRLLAVTLWDQHRLWTEMAQRQSQPPFASRLHNEANIAYCKARAARLATQKDHPLNRVIYERALEAKPGDYFLRARFAAYLQLNGHLDEALGHLQWIADTFPNFVGPHQDLGVNLLLLGRMSEAKASFERALELNPAYERARTALAFINEQSR